MQSISSNVAVKRSELFVTRSDPVGLCRNKRLDDARLPWLDRTYPYIVDCIPILGRFTVFRRKVSLSYFLNPCRKKPVETGARMSGKTCSRHSWARSNGGDWIFNEHCLKSRDFLMEILNSSNPPSIQQPLRDRRFLALPRGSISLGTSQIYLYSLIYIYTYIYIHTHVYIYIYIYISRYID